MLLEKKSGRVSRRVCRCTHSRVAKEGGWWYIDLFRETRGKVEESLGRRSYGIEYTWKLNLQKKYINSIKHYAIVQPSFFPFKGNLGMIEESKT